MLKISNWYLDSHQSYKQLTENSEKQMAYLQQNWVYLAEGRPFVSLNFQLIGHNFYVNQDIALKFSVYVHQRDVLSWQKRFGHYLISVSVAPPSVPKLAGLLAAMFVEIFL